MEQKKSYIRANDFAPKDGKLSVFFKKVGQKKSDGFALVENGEVYIIDSGLAEDDGLLDYLLSLRETWLAGATGLSKDERARLEIHCIVSHPHPDHIGALAKILSDIRICVMSIRAPMRSYRSTDVPEAIARLVGFENDLEALSYYLETFGHAARTIKRIPYGEKTAFPMGTCGTGITLYPSPYDWSEDRPSESEGFRFLMQYRSPTYLKDPEYGYANGILNGNSLWTKVTKAKQTALFTGDQRASDEMLGAMIRYYGESEFACDLLKLTHHGENNYCPQLLAAANPKAAIFTAARRFVTPETEALCKQMGVERYYLCDGNLLLTLDGKKIISEGIASR